MPLALDEAQRLYAESVERFWASLPESDRVARLIDEDRSPDPGRVGSLWARLDGELRSPALAIGGDLGGEDATWREAGIVLEATGRHLGAVPYLGVMVGVRLLQAAGDPIARGLLAEVATKGRRVLVAVQAGTFFGKPPATSLTYAQGRVDGAVDAVLDAVHGDVFVCPVATDEGLQLAVVEGAAATVTPVRSLDLTRGLARVAFSGAPGRLLACEHPVQALAAGLQLAAAAVAMECVGGAAACLESTVDYAGVRRQFDQPIGQFQAVKHALADVVRQLEPAKAAAHNAMEAIAVDDPEVAMAVSVAKLSAVEAYVAAAGAAIQLHGAIGFTWEHDLHLHFKRALTCRSLFGSAVEHRRVLAEALLEESNAARSAHSVVAGSPDWAGATAVRAEARAWLKANAKDAPRAGGAHEPMSYNTTPAIREWIDRLRVGGWLCLSWPPEYGGRGLGPLDVIAVNEEFARAGVSRPRLGMGESLVAPALLAHGTPEQKSRLLPRILSGEDIYCQGFSEPEAGSDLARLRTRGIVDGDEIVIDGEKIWQSGAHRANMIFVLCRTDPEAQRHRGISYVLVPMEDNGIEVEPIRMMTGDRGFNQVRLDGARAPLDNVIGGLDRGWHVAMTTLGAERAGDATTQHLGYRRELLALVTALGLTPADRDEIPPRLVDAFLEVELMRVSGRRIADSLLVGEAPEALLVVDKLNWSEYHAWFGEMAVEELGLDGLLQPPGEGYPLTMFQRVLLESRGRRIARGTNQVQRNIIAERLLGLPK